MAALQYNFSPTYAGREAFVPLGSWHLFPQSGSLQQVSAEYDGNNYSEMQFRLTGFYISKNGTNYYQEVGGDWCKWSSDAQLSSASAPQYSSGAAYSQINALIANNKHILENNLLCAKYADRLDISQRQRLYDLQERLQHRDEMLRNKQLMEQVTTSYPKGYVTWAQYLDAFMANGRVGAVGTIAVIVVAVIIIASLASAAYWAYKYYYAESVQDVKYSDELTKALASKLTPQEYEQLKQETAGMITKARLLERLGGFGSVAKYAAIGLLIFGVYYISNKQSKSKPSGRKYVNRQSTI